MGITMPRGVSGLQNPFAKKGDGVVAPRCVNEKLREEVVCHLGGKKIFIQMYRAVARQKIIHGAHIKKIRGGVKT